MDFLTNQGPRLTISKNNENIVCVVQFSAIFKERKIELSPIIHNLWWLSV